jgi:hypothetical protein
MTKYEARVKTKFGEIVFNYDTLDELKSNVESLDVNAVSDIMSKKFESVVEKAVREPKPGFEEVYRFTDSGLVELIRSPDNKAEVVAVVMFAYHPEPAEIEQIALSTGIKDVASRYLTHSQYKKFWTKVQKDKYGLTADGLEWVTKKIAPGLTTVGKEEESSSSNPPADK